MQLADLVEMVREHYDAPKDYIKRKKNTPEYTYPRHALRYILRITFEKKLETVAKLTGAHNHTTICHSVNVINDHLFKDDKIGHAFKRLLSKVESKLEDEEKDGFGSPKLER